MGAFDVVVLEAQNVDTLLQWLDDNGYEQDPEAAPIFQEYIDEGQLFAAFRLTHGAELDEIHPVTLTFNNSEPCIPLRLTRIAAADDMEVRAFFLGNARAAPTNYRHVLIDLLKINWDTNNKNSSYQSALIQAVDSLGADGRAFVTEYAGSSATVESSNLVGPMWDSAAFTNLDATQVVDVLTQQDLAECLPGQDCVFYHILVEGLLYKYLPVPDGLDASDFWGCLSCYEDMIDQGAWDGQGFADDLQERVVDPAIHADTMLDTWPYLTRLYTRISPLEMTEDPIFHTNESLPNVPNVYTVSRLTYTCLDYRRYTFPDGRVLYKWNGDTWGDLPDFPPSEKIQVVPLEGAPQTIVDNTPIIDQMLDQWHADQGLPPEPPSTTSGESDTSDPSDTSGTSGTSDSSQTDSGLTSGGPTDPGSTGGGTIGTAGPSGSDGDTDSGSSDSEGGCGCRSRDADSGAAVLLAAGLLAFRRRRSRI